MTVYHAIATTKTWCGLDAGSTRDERGDETPLPLIAPDRESVTCPQCLAAMPGPPPNTVKASEAVKRAFEAEAKRFANRRGAEPDEEEPGIDPSAIAAKVLQKGVGS